MQVYFLLQKRPRSLLLDDHRHIVVSVYSKYIPEVLVLELICGHGVRIVTAPGLNAFGDVGVLRIVDQGSAVKVRLLAGLRQSMVHIWWWGTVGPSDLLLCNQRTARE